MSSSGGETKRLCAWPHKAEIKLTALPLGPHPQGERGEDVVLSLQFMGGWIVGSVLRW
jgi:hypothetical protein